MHIQTKIPPAQARTTLDNVPDVSLCCCCCCCCARNGWGGLRIPDAATAAALVMPPLLQPRWLWTLQPSPTSPPSLPAAGVAGTGAAAAAMLLPMLL
eukprot:scaffold6570_cov23-Tisochrysis_lutea.AAC.1